MVTARFSAMLLLVCSVAQADQMTYAFTGSVTYVDPSLSGTFNTSQTLFGSFTYESSTPRDTGSPVCSGSGCYSEYPGGLTYLMMTVGSYTASTPSTGFNTVNVLDSFISGQDEFLVGGNGLAGAQLAGFLPDGSIILWDLSASVFADTTLTNVGDLTGWPTLQNRSSAFYLVFGPAEVRGSLTSLTQVPEPNSVVLLALLLCGEAVALLFASRIRRS